MNQTDGAVVEAALTADEARRLTDQVKVDAQTLWVNVLALYEGQAHIALGYTSWGAYWTAEFGGSQSRAYEMLDAGRVMKALEAHSEISERPESDAVAREMADLADDPEAMAEAWEETVEEHGPKPTAKQTRRKVREKKAAKPRGQGKRRGRKAEPPPAPEPPPEPKAKKAEDRDALSHEPGVVEYVWQRQDEGDTRAQIVAKIDGGDPAWQFPGQHLSNGAIGEIRAVIVHLKRWGVRPAPWPSKPRAQEKLRRLPKKPPPTGDYLTLTELATNVRTMADRLRSVNVEDDAVQVNRLRREVDRLTENLARVQPLANLHRRVLELTDQLERNDMSRLEYDNADEDADYYMATIQRDLVELQMWADRTLRSVDARTSDGQRLATIAHLRAKTVENGCQKGEAESAQRKADELEALRRNRLKAWDGGAS